ncbi:SDR family NAD(P)-dependent oxidoreductase [Halobacteriovorax sp. XZX-3]|uniref:SDR family NAD(P)-dependent oxidoreductase n=1 Tax=unclassified Halobacteriovorax TaxID=2639665 RepID=UPI003720294D
MNVSNHRDKKTVLITGATTGMGKAFADYFASLGYDLYLHGRNLTLLDQNAKEYREKYQVNCEIIIKDLCESEACEYVISKIKEPLSYLVNNAGFGVAGKYPETDIEKQVSMQRVHVEVPMRLSHHFLQQKEELKIINIASLYAFFPVPRQSVYAASKSMIHSFSLALGRDLSGTNKQVISVCPGLVYTQFRINQGKAEKQHFSGISSEQVVNETIGALSKNKFYIVPGFLNKIFKTLLTTMPHTLTLRIIERVNTGRGY